MLGTTLSFGVLIKVMVSNHQYDLEVKATQNLKYD